MESEQISSEVSDLEPEPDETFAATKTNTETGLTSQRHMASTGYTLPSPSPGPVDPVLGRPPSAKRNNPIYTLSDGSVVSGKGLGRGRPGVKRGPRKSKLSNEIVPDSDMTGKSLEPTSIPGYSFINFNPAAGMKFERPPQTPPGANSTNARKRKRTDSIGSQEPEMERSQSITSSPEYTPQSTQTRFGRQTQRPVTLLPSESPTSESIVPSVAIHESPQSTSPTAKKTPTTSTFVKPHTPVTHPKIKRKIYRGRESLALCEHCLRGNGPVGNVIVFCDACNHCWHQRCHDPPISKETVADKNADWFCASCDEILHPEKKRREGSGGKKGKKRARKPDNIAATTAPSPSNAAGPNVSPDLTTTPAVTSARLNLMPANTLTRDQRQSYLNTLPRERLVALLMHATDLAPNLALFPSLSSSSATATSTITSTSTPSPSIPNPNPSQVVQPPHTTAPSTPLPLPTPHLPKLYTPQPSLYRSPQSTHDEPYTFEPDELVQLYPKPGHGVVLPPEANDLHMLLEGPETRTFSHWVGGTWGVDGGGPSEVLLHQHRAIVGA